MRGSIAVLGLVIPGSLVIIFKFVVNPLLARQPEVVVAEILLGLLPEPESIDLGNVGKKSNVCWRLQLAASHLEKIPKRIAISDAAAGSAVRERIGASAVYLRVLQQQVVLANEKTLIDLREGLISFISAFVIGEYDSLPVPTGESSESHVRRDLASLTRAVVVAVIPIACIIAVNYAGLKLSEGFTGWAVVISIAWAAITMISFIDPLYKSRLADMKEFISMFRNGES